MSAAAVQARAQAEAIGPGVFVAVVGPSGAGKDTLLNYAKAQLAGEDRCSFVRRTITRPCDMISEDHETLHETAFDEAEAAGAFALSWEAHGLKYGLPARVDDVLAAGGVAVANVSRAAIATLRTRYRSVMVVEVTANAETLAARLASRGRESRGEVLARLARFAPTRIEGATTIDNSGSPEIAGERLVSLLREAMERATELQK
jgi:ribose 1,5-bisphosphokinase